MYFEYNWNILLRLNSTMVPDYSVQVPPCKAHIDTKALEDIKTDLIAHVPDLIGCQLWIGADANNTSFFCRA